MKKTKFFKPYKPNGKTNLAFTRKQSGVYIIKEKGKIVYVGHSSSQLYKTITRHFQSWYDPRQYRATYTNRKNYTIRVILTTPGRAQKLEKGLICKYKPRDNKEKYKEMCATPAMKRAVSTYENAIYSKFADMELPF